MTDDTYKDNGFLDSEIDDELSKIFKENPSIENYLKLRKNNPDAEIEVAISGGLEWLFANESTLTKHGIEPALFAKILDANHSAISELSLQLLGMLDSRDKAEEAGETHLVGRGVAISDSLANYIINTMLDATSWNDELYIPRDLIVLIRHQLGGGINNEISQHQKSHDRKFSAMSIGAQLLERGETLSSRKVASILNVNVSTVSRMYPGNALAEASAEFLETMRKISGSETPFADSLDKFKK